MRRPVLLAILAISAIVLQACASITLSPAGPYRAGKTAVYTLGRDWNDVTAYLRPPTGVKALTLDGQLLNCLYLTDGLTVGQSLIRRVSKEKPVPVYRKGMAGREQVEFVTDSLSAMGFVSVESSNLSRATVSGKTGIRFEIKAVTAEGLQISGLGQVVENGDRLYVAAFLAPSEHYFQDGKEEAAQILGSLQL